MYRFRELLPLADGEEPVTLGEGGTPLLALPRLAAHLGLRHLWAKDEGQNPTGTFKARGLGMAITRARTLGVTGLMIPSAGNAGGAAAVYGARAGVSVAVVVPRDTPEAAVAEAMLAGAHVFTVDGTIATAGRVIAAVAPRIGWFDLATLKEPYRLEGKKTMGLELAEQLGWDDARTGSCIRPAAAPASSASGRPTRSSPPWAGSRPPSRASSPCRPRGARRWCAPGRTRPRPPRGGRTRSPTRPACACPGPSRAGRCCASCERPEGFPDGGQRAGDRRGPAAAGAGRGDLDGPRGRRRRSPRSFGCWTSGRSTPAARVVLVLTGAGIKYPPPPLAAASSPRGPPDEILARVRRASAPNRLDSTCRGVGRFSSIPVENREFEATPGRRQP